jgi:hypothetical protein
VIIEESMKEKSRRRSSSFENLLVLPTGMSTSLQSEPTGSRRVSHWWLRVVRTVALCSLLSILVPWYAAIFRDLSRQERFDLLWPILFCPLWLPYVWVFWGLRSNAGANTLKKALAVAFGCGSLILALFSFLLALTSFDMDRQVAVVYALVVLLQIALVFGAVKAYYSMGREPGDLRILAARLWIPVVGIAAAAIILPNLFLPKRAPDEASAVGSLRSINSAQAEYARTHPDRGFASSLAELGPGSGDLIDSVLASGKKNNYVFILTAAPADSHGCIVRYSIMARPQHYGKNIKRNFFMDESGILRFTTENRAATAQDSAL